MVLLAALLLLLDPWTCELELEEVEVRSRLFIRRRPATRIVDTSDDRGGRGREVENSGWGEGLMVALFFVALKKIIHW